MVFLATKTYPSLESLLDIHGALWLYFFFGFLGFVFLYVFLPETENRTLEEIEYHFATQPMTEKVIAKLSEEKIEVEAGGKASTLDEGVDGKNQREDLELL